MSDTATRVMVATIALIVALSWFNGCASIWDAAGRVLP